MSEGYNGRIKWRLTNNTNATLYDLSISDKEYTLASGETVSCLGERITSTLAPGESKTTQSDAVNTTENYGAWSDKNDNSVVRIKLVTLMITFSLEKYGNRMSWNELGAVKLKSGYK